MNYKKKCWIYFFSNRSFLTGPSHFISKTNCSLFDWICSYFGNKKPFLVLKVFHQICILVYKLLLQFCQTWSSTTKDTRFLAAMRRVLQSLRFWGLVIFLFYFFYRYGNGAWFPTRISFIHSHNFRLWPHFYHLRLLSNHKARKNTVVWTHIEFAHSNHRTMLNFSRKVKSVASIQHCLHIF